MKKNIVVLLAALVAGIGVSSLGLAYFRGLARQNEALARYVDEADSDSAIGGLKLSDPVTRRDLPCLMAALSKEDGSFEQAYLWVYSKLPDYARARLPEIYPSAMIRLNAAAVVGRWGPSAKFAVPQLVRLLRDDMADSNAALSLGQIGPDAREAIPALVSAVEEHRPWSATALGMIGPAAGVARSILHVTSANGPEWQRLEIGRVLPRVRENLSAQN